MRLLACLLVLSGLVDASHHSSSLQSQFAHFAKKFGKEYEGQEVFTRVNNFKDNLEAIQKLSKLNSHRSFRVGVNSLADLSFDEYRARYLSPIQVEGARKHHSHKAAHAHHGAPHHSHSLPTSFDWRSKGVVSPVKDQADCGGAGAIVGLETLESAWGIKHSFIELSQEEIIDCASTAACSNLDLKSVYTFAEKNGVCDSSSYPPSSSNSTTCSSSLCTPASKFTSHTSISPSTSDSFLAAVAKQPVAAAIEADSMVFQLYAGGILDSPVCGTTLNHVVLIVGWGSENGTDYWIAQNSWGVNWGENGIVRIARGKNVCGIESQGMYPISA